MASQSPFASNNILVLSEIDSTNTYALKAVHAGKMGHGAVVQALQQTAGRGQRNNVWRSEAGKDLLVSLVIKPQEYGITNIFLLNMAVCVALHQVLRTKCPNVSIKWSNDIYVGNNKISGVLIENAWRGEQWNYAVIGIGININSVEHAQLGLQATGIFAEAAEQLSVEQVRDEVLYAVHTNLVLCAADGKNCLLQYNKYLKDKGNAVPFNIANQTIMATIIGVEADGKIVLDINGAHKKFAYGEAKWMV